MNSREKGPGKIRKAKDRQEAFQIEAFGKRAERLLATYSWSSEEEAFLRLIVEKKLSFPDIKLLTRSQVNLERNVLVFNGREYYLSAETGGALSAFLSSGAPEGDELFSPVIARSLRIALSREE